MRPLILLTTLALIGCCIEQPTEIVRPRPIIRPIIRPIVRPIIRDDVPVIPTAPTSIDENQLVERVVSAVVERLKSELPKETPPPPVPTTPQIPLVQESYIQWDNFAIAAAMPAQGWNQEPIEEKPRRRVQWEFHKIPNCVPCDEASEKIQEMRNVGWIVSEDENAHVRIITEYDAVDAEFPYFVLRVDGMEKERCVGYPGGKFMAEKANETLAKLASPPPRSVITTGPEFTAGTMYLTSVDRAKLDTAFDLLDKFFVRPQKINLGNDPVREVLKSIGISLPRDTEITISSIGGRKKFTFSPKTKASASWGWISGDIDAITLDRSGFTAQLLGGLANPTIKFDDLKFPQMPVEEEQHYGLKE